MPSQSNASQTALLVYVDISMHTYVCARPSERSIVHCQIFFLSMDGLEAFFNNGTGSNQTGLMKKTSGYPEIVTKFN